MKHKGIIKLLCAAIFGVFCLSLATSCAEKKPQGIVVGAENFDAYLPLLEGKRVGFVGNNTSVLSDGTHVVDFLQEKGVNVVKAFGPEHGFRGDADAGEHVEDQIDPKTGIPVISLYGKINKPTPEMLSDVDVLVFDLQDVGCRFYTYIYLLQRVMEAGGENNVPVVVLDRPNPNGFYIDGPILEDTCRSGIGMQPMPIVYALTIGELAKLYNGEGWLRDSVTCDLTVIPCLNYDHTMRYSLPVPPSPNLPTDRSINLYASTCFVEGTPMSEGRGTPWPFEVLGSPLIDSNATDFTFTPAPSFGDKNPKQNGVLCYGLDLRQEPEQAQVNLDYIIWAYNNYTDKENFFNHRGFSLRAGNYELEEQIKAGMTPEQIKATWQPGLDSFKQVRKKYLMYPDFE